MLEERDEPVPGERTDQSRHVLRRSYNRCMLATGFLVWHDLSTVQDARLCGPFTGKVIAVLPGMQAAFCDNWFDRPPSVCR